MFQTIFTKQAGVEYPIICGAMYPCSNPELVAAVSNAGGLGIVQPLSLVYVHGYDFRKGLQFIRSLTNRPYGMNIIVEKTSRIYEKRMEEWVDISLEEGCRFFITALGNPSWVIKKVKAANGYIYHDVTEKKWAEKVLNLGVDGLICVNNRAGGHAGIKSPEEMIEELRGFGVPLVCAGGIGNEQAFVRAIKLGYSAVQMGTRFIATHECNEKSSYKNAIIDAEEKDIILTERVTGIPLSVIRTPYVDSIGTKVSPIARFLLKHRLTKQWLRLWYNIRAIRRFKKITLEGGSSKDYWQAGKSVAGIETIQSVQEIIQNFANQLEK